MRTLLLLLVTAVASGCGDSASSCDQRAVNNACIEFTGSTAFVEAYKSACVDPGVYAETACQKEGQVGGCRQAVGPDILTTWFYSGGSNTAASVMAACTAPNSFVVP